MSDLAAILEPGMLVRNSDAPEWGVGQVQSNVDGRVTINFREKGKVVMQADRVSLELVFDTSDTN
ncbi:DUF3553 domain-containing protein [Pseudaestuariivita sp.]|uniref:DUF3553 domain-containing protein n=1 Tax=Pseudaestuariivita sp. TaxID=2211669 RepID=UPI004058F73A